MKIVHAVRQYPPGVGGVEAVVSSLAERQARAGNQVRVVTLDRIFDSDGAPLARTEWRNGVEVIRVGYRGSRKYPFAPGALRALAGSDVVHVHGVEFFADFFGWTKPLHRKPLILSTHGGFFHTAFAGAVKKLWFQTVTRATLRQYAFVAASSVQDAEIFRRIAGDKVVTIENGVDFDKFAHLACPDSAKMIYFGRLAPNKGLERLLDWFASLTARAGDWRLIIAGKEMGVSFDGLRRQAARLGVADRIELHDTPSDAALRQLVAQSSVFVCASRFEGFGMAAVEAIGAGLFPVLSDIAPFRRTIERAEIGMTSSFEPGADIDRFLAECVAHGAGKVSGAQSGPDLSVFGWGEVLERTHDLYTQAIAGEGRRSRTRSVLREGAALPCATVQERGE